MNSYFSHDSNARNSDKLINVRMSLGAEGYGIYFMILERLREEKDYMSVKDYNVIAFDLRVDASAVKKVVEDFGLFVFTENGKYFYSESFLRRMAIKDEKSRKKSDAGKKGAAKRWGKKDDQIKDMENSKDIAMPLDNNSNAIAQPKKNIASKVKESKVKQSKTTTNSDSGEKIAIVARAFEENGFGTINATIRELLINLINQYSTEWILEAMKIAVKANVRRLNYVEGILKRWHTEGGMNLGGVNDGTTNDRYEQNTTKADEDEARRAGITLL